MNNYFVIDFSNPPREYFPLPYQQRLDEGRAGQIKYTSEPLIHGKDTGKVYWDLYINAIIQKALRDNRTHDGDTLWSGGSVFFFPAGKYHLNGNLYFYDTDPTSKHYGQCWTNVNIYGQDTATKFIGEAENATIYMTGYCNEKRRESAMGGWMRSFWTQRLNIQFGLYDEEFEKLHGVRPNNPQNTHGIWSFYLDKLYVNIGGLCIKRLSSDISITDSVFDYGARSIEILDHVYSVTIQNNHFWNRGQRVRIVHSQQRFDWNKYFNRHQTSQREGYKRGGLVIISGNRDNSPGTSNIPADEGAFHIENCDTVIFTNNYSQDTRQPINIPAGEDENYGGRISPEFNFCNGRALNIKNCRYVNVANNVFGSYWPKQTGVVTFDNTHYSSITNNIFTPIGGMNREKDQIDTNLLKNLPKAYAIDVNTNCSHIIVSQNIVEEIGPFTCNP